MKKNALLLMVIALVSFASALTYHTLLKKEVSSIENTTQTTAKELREATKKWTQIIKEIGPKEAHARFLAEAPSSREGAHDQAHAFGEALYSVEGLSGLSYCDSSFDFGCYHSFFGVAVHEEGIDILSKFSDACKSRFGDFNLPCEHGIGHGVLVYTDYENLEDALELCETISTLPTGGCSSGVFMENNFHTMDSSVSAEYLRPIGNDLYAPCNILPQSYQPSCYLEQVQFWQSHFQNDFTYIGELCSALDGENENFYACFHGIGNYLSASVDRNIERTIEGCRLLAGSRGEGLCLEGASWLVRGDGSGIDEAKLLCEAVNDTQGRIACYNSLE